jgi:hypothetical protein
MNDLDSILRADARVELADEGFGARVMQALPRAASRERPWLRPALVMGSAALGSVLAAALSPQGGALLQGFQDLMFLRAGSAPAIAGLAMCGALLASALVLATDPD